MRKRLSGVPFEFAQVHWPWRICGSSSYKRDPGAQHGDLGWVWPVLGEYGITIIGWRASYETYGTSADQAFTMNQMFQTEQAAMAVLDMRHPPPT